MEDNSEDEAMKEIRKIRDANSKRHYNMSFDELKAELEESRVWFFLSISEECKITRLSDGSGWSIKAKKILTNNTIMLLCNVGGNQ